MRTQQQRRVRADLRSHAIAERHIYLAIRSSGWKTLKWGGLTRTSAPEGPARHPLSTLSLPILRAVGWGGGARLDYHHTRTSLLGDERGGWGRFYSPTTTLPPSLSLSLFGGGERERERVRCNYLLYYYHYQPTLLLLARSLYQPPPTAPATGCGGGGIWSRRNNLTTSEIR